MRRIVLGAACVWMASCGAQDAAAQGWSGGFLGATVGMARPSDRASESVVFDTNLDGVFNDTVRTAAGADAFASGFCSGLALGATPSMGCTDDEDGLDIGLRGGYDWQFGRLVVGAVADLSWPDVTDSVTAYSTTPAFYAFSSDIDWMLGLRARAGVGTGPVLIYGTGGPARVSVDQVFTTSNTVNTFVQTMVDGDGAQAVWGYQAGGGAEVVVGRLRLFGEYLYTAADNREHFTVRSQGPAPATNPFIIVNASGTDLQPTQRLELHAIRAGVAFTF